MKQCPECDYLSEEDHKYCANCGTTLEHAKLVETVFIVAERFREGFIQKGDQFATLAELKEHNKNFLWSFEGMYVFRAKKRHVDGGILFHPIEAYAIQEEGFLATVREQISVRIIKPS